MESAKAPNVDGVDEPGQVDIGILNLYFSNSIKESPQKTLEFFASGHEALFV